MSISDLEVTYPWADGIYVKAGLEKDKAALLVVIGALSNGEKRILACEPGYRESKGKSGERHGFVMETPTGRGEEFPVAQESGIITGCLCRGKI